MGRNFARSTTVSVRYYRMGEVEARSLACRSCRCRLDWHQPDPGRDDQLLATCPRCGRWHRIETWAADRQAVVIVVPTATDVVDPAPSTQAPPLAAIPRFPGPAT